MWKNSVNLLGLACISFCCSPHARKDRINPLPLRRKTSSAHRCGRRSNRRIPSPTCRSIGAKRSFTAGRTIPVSRWCACGHTTNELSVHDQFIEPGSGRPAIMRFVILVQGSEIAPPLGNIAAQSAEVLGRGQGRIVFHGDTDMLKHRGL